jgi:transcriptional regulator with XRE-family HTH domain
MDITGAQVRAARAFLDWNISDLAKVSGVSDKTIRLIENRGSEPQISGGLDATADYRSAGRMESMTKLRDALTAAGIVFVADKEDGPGIYCKDSD